MPEDRAARGGRPEIGLILGGHEHTPFAGRMGHGANAASVGAGVAANDADGGGGACVNDEAGTLCVKAGMDAECVVVVEVELPEPDGDGRDAVGADRGGECTAANAAGGRRGRGVRRAETPRRLWARRAVVGRDRRRGRGVEQRRRGADAVRGGDGGEEDATAALWGGGRGSRRPPRAARR